MKRFIDICLLGSWRKKDKKLEVICMLRVYILHMYLYYKGDDVYRVMLLLALTLQPSHISVDSESLPLPVTVIKFNGLQLSHDFVSVSALIGFNHGVLYK